jgi:hypothetical protein
VNTAILPTFVDRSTGVFFDDRVVLSIMAVALDRKYPLARQLRCEMCRTTASVLEDDTRRGIFASYEAGNLL